MITSLSTNTNLVSVTLNKANSGRYYEYCRDMHIKCNVTEIGNGFKHFVAIMTKDELAKANEFLTTF